jgi:hypothetical protein
MPTKTGYWIRVKNGQVKDVWDYKPSDDKLAAESGWREAVEDACLIWWPTARL